MAFFYSEQEAADKLRISLTRLRLFVEQGKISATRRGSRVLINTRDLNQFREGMMRLADEVLAAVGEHSGIRVLCYSPYDQRAVVEWEADRRGLPTQVNGREGRDLIVGSTLIQFRGVKSPVVVRDRWTTIREDWQ